MLILDLRSSWLESHLFTDSVKYLTFAVKPGPSNSLDRPGSGPYDERLGFTHFATFLNHLKSQGYVVAAQARDSRFSTFLTRAGLFPIYHEKAQAGLQILDRNGNPLFQRIYPRQIYPDFDSVPPLVVNTILFIENRYLRDPEHPYRNPAIEWDRLARAVVELGVHKIDHHYPLIGGSTLATQLEKVRHSPGGRTGSVGEKFRQVASASLRAYQDGRDTRQAEERVVCDYINSIPLAATASNGEVIGLADGLRAWYDADFNSVNGLFEANENSLSPDRMKQRARAFREVLSLFLALRAPSFYLHTNPEALDIQTDRYLRVLAENRIISPRLRDLALHARAEVAPRSVPHSIDFVSNKAPDAIRVSLLHLLGVDNSYDLDRLDLTVRTTLDKSAEASATNFLRGLSQSSNVESAGLHQYQLLDQGNPDAVVYSATIYERGHGQNLLRLETDNYNHPLDINNGTKLQLGSTAKLRTLILYLQIMTDLHAKYAGASQSELQSAAAAVLPGDNLSAWAISYLSTAPDKSLEAMLQAALDRKYSGSPGESFFTAGGSASFR